MYSGVNGKGIIEKGQESNPQNIPRASPGTTLICFGTPPKWERMENFKPQKYFDHPLQFTSRVFLPPPLPPPKALGTPSYPGFQGYLASTEHEQTNFPRVLSVGIRVRLSSFFDLPKVLGTISP